MTMPTGWASAELGDVTQIGGGIQKQQKRRPADNPVPFLRVANVGNGSLDLSEVHDIELFDGELERLALRAGDLLVVEGNGSPSQIGRAAVWHGEIEPCVHQNHLIRVRPLPLLNPEYLGHYWNSPQARQRVRDVASTTSGLYTLSTGKLRPLPVVIAPLAEQARIVAAIEEAFSLLDAGEASLHATRTRLRRMRESVLTAAVAGHLVPQEAADTPASAFLAGAGVATLTDVQDLPFVPPSWRWVTLGLLADVVGGVTKDTRRQNDPGTVEVPYLRVANVQRGYLDLTTVATIRVPQAKAAQLVLKHGDVLFNEGGDRDKLGRGWVWQDQVPNCIHQNHVYRARLTAGVQPKLVSWWGNTYGRAWFEVHGKQTTNLASINLTTLKAFPVPVPPPEEQVRIVTEVDRQFSFIDAAEQAVADNLKRSVALRRSVLQAAFEGRLVPQDPSDEPASVLLERIRAERAGAGSPGARRGRRKVGG